MKGKLTSRLWPDFRGGCRENGRSGNRERDGKGEGRSREENIDIRKRTSESKRVGRHREGTHDAVVRGYRDSTQRLWEEVESQPDGPSHLPENRKKTAG